MAAAAAAAAAASATCTVEAETQESKVETGNLAPTSYKWRCRTSILQGLVITPFATSTGANLEVVQSFHEFPSLNGGK